MQIVILHKGNQKYVRQAVKHNQKWCKSHQVTLIGDDSNRKFSKYFINWNELENSLFEKFKCNYKHLSLNDFEYELRCFERYFVLYEYLRKRNLPQCIHLDSDVLLYTDFSSVDFDKYDIGVSSCHYPVLQNECASPHLSFWRINVLEEFLNFIIDYYENHFNKLETIYEYNRSHNLLWVSGICDMVLLTEFIRQKDLRCINFNKRQGNKVFDHNIHVGDNYKENEYCLNEKLHMKKVTFEKRIPYFTTELGNEKVQALSLHLQGEIKQYCSLLVNGINDENLYRAKRFLKSGYVLRRLAGKAKRKILSGEREKTVEAEPKFNHEYIILDTSIESKNVGDDIIMSYCHKKIDDFAPDAYSIPTHVVPTVKMQEHISEESKKLLCGTNILCQNLRWSSLWKLPENISNMKNIILYGVGWESYSPRACKNTENMLKMMLSKNYYHAVRDEYTKRQLQLCGIENVLYTGCPTMWNLTDELCKTIPQGKGENVITSVHAYNKSLKRDLFLLKTLIEEYKKVYVWLQSDGDEAYAKELLEKLEYKKDDVIFIEGNLENYRNYLRNLSKTDYVGLRLHGGIEALNMGHRTIIVAVDNRATEMARSTNLTIIDRSVIQDKLSEKINSVFETKITMPWENIEKFNKQFWEKK